MLDAPGDTPNRRDVQSQLDAVRSKVQLELLRETPDEVDETPDEVDEVNELDEFAPFINAKVSWLIEDIVMENDTFFLYGAEQQGKTFIATSLAVALVLGQPWMGRAVAKPSQVIFIATESPQDVAQRLQAVRNEVFEAESCGIDLMTMKHRITPDTDGKPSPFIMEVRNKTRPDPKSIVLVLDNLKDLIDGDVNSQRDVSEAFEALTQLRRRAKRKGMSFTVIIVHHSGKDAERGMLGSSMLAAGSATRAEVRNGTFTVKKNRFGPRKVSVLFAIATSPKGVGYAVPADSKKPAAGSAPAAPAARPAVAKRAAEPAPKSVNPETIVREAASKEEATCVYYEAAFGGDPGLPAFESVSYGKEPRKEQARNKINSAIRGLKKRGLIAVDAEGNISHA